MAEHPYSIYIDQRPVRVAYLIPHDADDALFDNIVEYNRSRWGGRFNPIILTDGISINKRWWEWLRRYDADFIRSFVDLDSALLGSIHTFLAPFRVEVDTVNRKADLSREYPISMMPSPDIVGRISWRVDGTPPLAIFDVGDSAPPDIRNFVNRNFGSFGNPMDLHVKSCLADCETRRYQIDDITSLNDALTDLGQSTTHFVFPAQLCAVPNVLPDLDTEHRDSRFQVVIGPSAVDLARFWNRALMVPKWLRCRMVNLWAPRELVTNAALAPGLAVWLRRYGSLSEDGIAIVSHDAPVDELSRIARSLHKMNVHNIGPNTKGDEPTGTFATSPPLHARSQSTALHRAHGPEEHIVVADPDVRQGSIGGESWVADVRIQALPGRFTGVENKDYWWELPRRSWLPYDLDMFNRRARTNASRYFSLLMSRRSSGGTGLPSGDSALVVKVPEDRRVIDALVCGTRFDCASEDIRDRFASRPFHNTHVSDKGGYLHGLVGLFGGIDHAHFYFKERFWRSVFETMSNAGETDRSLQLAAITNKLVKHSTRVLSKSADREWLAEYVIQTAQRLKTADRDLAFEDLASKAKSETDGDNAGKPDDQRKVEEDLKAHVSDLLEMNVLIPGINPRCPTCGYPAWYHVSDVREPGPDHGGVAAMPIVSGARSLVGRRDT